jgi:hypothetical protein
MREAGLVVGAFVALSIAATWPLVRYLTGTLPGDLGDPLLNAWTLGWAADRIRHGFIGFWHAPILYPARYTFGFSENLLGIAIFVAPIIWVTGNPILAHNVAFVLSYTLAGAGMYLLARELTHRRDAAMIAGAIYAFAPMRASYVSHIQVLASGWMPLALWGLHRYFVTRSVRPLAIFVAAFTLEAWSNAYFLYFLAIPTAAVVLNEFAPTMSTRGIDPRTLRKLVVAAGAILLLIAWMLFTYAAIRHLYGLHRGPGDWRMFSADLQSYVSVPDAVPFWRDVLSGDRAPERQLFPGLIALLLAAAAIGGGTAYRRVTRLYAAIGAVAVILSLGPELKVWTHRLPVPGPFLWLARIVPGLDGIRAPARLAVVVLLSVAVLAAIGFSRLQVRWPQRRPWIAAAVLVGVFVEGWAVPMRVVAFDAKGRREDRRLYRWLAGEPAGAVLELPIYDWSIAPTLTYQYATLFHRHPIVNGYSGYGTALQGFLGGSASPMRELNRMSDALAMLRSLGLRYVIVHPSDYEDPEVGASTAAAIRASSADVAAEQRFEEATAFRLRDAPALPPSREAGAQVDLRQFVVTASDNQDRVALAFDGNPATRWMTGHSQNGSEWMRIQLDRPRDITRIAFVMEERTLGDYPRDLVIESSTGGAPSILYQGATVIAFGRSIASNTLPPEIAIDLPGNLTRTLTIRQAASSRRWWSIHELKIWTR